MIVLAVLATACHVDERTIARAKKSFEDSCEVDCDAYEKVGVIVQEKKVRKIDEEIEFVEDFDDYQDEDSYGDEREALRIESLEFEEDKSAEYDEDEESFEQVEFSEESFVDEVEEDYAAPLR